METAEHTIESTEEVGAVSMSPSTSLFDTDRFRKIASDVQYEYGMGGLCGTVYEEWALDICKRYVSNVPAHAGAVATSVQPVVLHPCCGEQPVTEAQDGNWSALIHCRKHCGRHVHLGSMEATVKAWNTMMENSVICATENEREPHA